MTLIIAALIGGLLGWSVNLLAVYLPRFAVTRPDGFQPRPLLAAPALFSWRKKDLLGMVVEVSSMIFLAWVGFRYGWSQRGVLLAAGWAFFLLIAVMDIRYRLVLNVLTYPALVILAVGHLALNPRYFPNVLVGGMLAFAIFYLVARLKPGDVGSGDIKLAALIGVCFGFPHMLWALLLGAGVGAVAAVALIARRPGTKSYMPYAPFLCLGALVALLVLA